MGEGELKDAWIRTRAARSVSLLEEALQEVMGKHHPADQFLNRVFRQDRRIGGRDRRLYSNLIFAVFRWYGPLRKHSSDPAFLLAGAAAAEKYDLPEITFFLKQAGLPETCRNEIFAPETPLARLNAFLHLSGYPADLSGRECLPEWIYSHLDFEPDEDFLALQQIRPPLWLRVQRKTADEVIESLRRQNIEAVPDSRMEPALRIDCPVNLPELEAYKRGWIEVQDLSSQCIGKICAPQEGECWWDACAGGGGKSLHLASLMNGKGTITASDVRGTKLEELRQRAKRAGFSNLRTREWDGAELPVGENSCDGVLIDAPCSSSGRWRRNPESRWLLTEERVTELASVQKKLLDIAAKAVKPGGVLVYATCSLLRDENRPNTESFPASHSAFMLEGFAHPLTGKTMSGQVQILPVDGDCDASFIARFRKGKQP
ncbi:MAG: RsmB/NOP family class I SAM-dependent RNA methyltransferase [Lentisphaeria bacterium]|nr:RsmB/NOP family class I SAM-dependent RNA methyltransferase [Lentisphaeria bacterium]